MLSTPVVIIFLVNKMKQLQHPYSKDMNIIKMSDDDAIAWALAMLRRKVHDSPQLAKNMSAVFDIDDTMLMDTAEEDTVTAIGDGEADKWSSGNKVLRWTSRGQPGQPQWIVGRFAETKNIRSVGIFWMDRWQGDVRFPKEWSLEVEINGEWKPFELYTTDKYDARANQFNVVHPAAPTKCDAIRIHITPQEETAVGIIEVQVQMEQG